LLDGDALNPGSRDIALSFVDYFLSHIDTDYLSISAGHLGGDDEVQTGPAPSVNDLLARQYIPNRNGLPVPAKDSMASSDKPYSQWSWYSNKVV